MLTESSVDGPFADVEPQDARERLEFYEKQQQLLVDLAARLMLVTAEEPYAQLSGLLRPLTEAADADRIMMVMLDRDTDCLSCRAEWHRPGVTPATPFMQNIPFQTIADLVVPLQEGRVLVFEDVNDLPADHFLPRMVAKLGLPSILMVPLTWAGWG